MIYSPAFAGLFLSQTPETTLNVAFTTKLLLIQALGKDHAPSLLSESVQ